ncbi:hypothetical protein [Staphylococcus phage Stab23]|nr:hypothetical protein [Staphylococcus phage Stab23]
MDRIIGKHNLTQELKVGDRVEVYDAHKFKENEDGTIELGEKITEGVVVNLKEDYTTSGLVTLDSSEEELIIGEYNFKLIEEGNLQVVYETLSKDKADSLYEDIKMYKKLLNLKENELRDLREKIEDLVFEHNSKAENYNELVTLSKEKAKEFSVLKGYETYIRHTRNRKIGLHEKADS